MIFDPTDPRCAKVAKIMVIYCAKDGNQYGHDDSPTFKKIAFNFLLLNSRNLKPTLAKYSAKRIQLRAVNKFWIDRNVFAAFNLQ